MAHPNGQLIQDSRNSNTPFFPAIQRAARSAPWRILAAARGVAQRDGVRGESKPISCVPVCAPRDCAEVSKPVYPAARISSASFFSVPEGDPSWRNDEFPSPGFVFGCCAKEPQLARRFR